MALQRRGTHSYGDGQLDIREELVRYSKINTYLAHHFADATCVCGSKLFYLRLDDGDGVAARKCVNCASEHLIGDSADYLEDAEMEVCACPCGREEFEITAAVSLYPDSQDVRWLYIGCRCSNCGLTAVYGDWKNEFVGYQDLLARV